MKHYLIRNRSLPLKHLHQHIAHVGATHKKHLKGGMIVGASPMPSHGPIRELIPTMQGQGVKHRKHIKPLHIRF